MEERIKIEIEGNRSIEQVEEDCRELLQHTEERIKQNKRVLWLARGCIVLMLVLGLLDLILWNQYGWAIFYFLLGMLNLHTSGQLYDTNQKQVERRKELKEIIRLIEKYRGQSRK